MGKNFAETVAERGYSCRYLAGEGDHEVDYWESALDPAFSFLCGIPAGSRNDIRKLFP